MEYFKQQATGGKSGSLQGAKNAEKGICSSPLFFVHGMQGFMGYRTQDVEANDAVKGGTCVTGNELNRWLISEYKPGQFVVCTIVQQVDGGYAVSVDKGALPGVLPSDREHAIGSQVKAAFVCVDKGQLLLSEKFSFEIDDEEKGQAPKFPLLPIDDTSEGEESIAASEPSMDDFV